jgi:hypothetical protein
VGINNPIIMRPLSPAYANDSPAVERSPDAEEKNENRP